MSRNVASFKSYIKMLKEDGSPSTAGAGVMGVGGTSDVKLDLPLGSKRPDAKGYRERTKSDAEKLLKRKLCQ